MCDRLQPVEIAIARVTGKDDANQHFCIADFCIAANQVFALVVAYCDNNVLFITAHRFPHLRECLQFAYIVLLSAAW